MNIKIFQLTDLEFGIVQLEFMMQETITINANSFVLKYEYTREAKEKETVYQVLNEIWNKFNRDDRPNGQEMHSLSISDVVAIDETHYICSVMGWKEIRFEGREVVNLK